MQEPRYSSADEQLLMAKLWSPAIANDPEAFVNFAFPWGEKGTPLEHFRGPRKWQREVLRDLKTHIAANNGKVDFRSRYRQVGTGVVAHPVDGHYPHRVYHHRLG